MLALAFQFISDTEKSEADMDTCRWVQQKHTTRPMSWQACWQLRISGSSLSPMPHLVEFQAIGLSGQIGMLSTEKGCPPQTSRFLYHVIDHQKSCHKLIEEANWTRFLLARDITSLKASKVNFLGRASPMSSSSPVVPSLYTVVFLWHICKDVSYWRHPRHPGWRGWSILISHGACNPPLGGALGEIHLAMQTKTCGDSTSKGCKPVEGLILLGGWWKHGLKKERIAVYIYWYKTKIGIWDLRYWKYTYIIIYMQIKLCVYIYVYNICI